MAKHVTVAQLDSVVDDITTKADGRFLKNADKGALATKDKVAETDLGTELGEKLNGKANAATSISGYNITDAYTKTEVDEKIAGAVTAAYKSGGSKTAAELTSALLVAANEGKVYTVPDELTTTADFKEGAGKTYGVGANVVVFNDGTDETPSYKFDVLAGYVDLSGYATKTNATTSTAGLMSAEDKNKLDGFEEASASDISAIIDGIWPAENTGD